MMTAMNLSHLPPALVRSGRVELWLEMKLPDAQARRRILQMHMAGIPGELAECDSAQVVAATEGFTGADVKRLVDDAKGLYAFHRATKGELRTGTGYFLEAAKAVRENKQRYEHAQATVQPRPRAQDHIYWEPPTVEED
jgi:ATP-dependent 26S proteasome regulatory subunit